jgi:acyl carrier protein
MSSLKELQELIKERYDIDPATLDVDLSMREQGLDSLALAEFLFDVEDRFSLSLPDTADHADTLSGLAALIDRLRAQQAA